ncbi:uncharacterized protein [Amphiura filiformis]|uniref:uncharacterized protein n=1 Tax=Amphiura filiformis TaxID=82378 RepID=UPI003B21C882
MWSTILVLTNCFLVVLSVPLVNIAAPTEQGGSSPTEGNQIFYMECSIQNFQTPGSPASFRSAWSKDGDIIIWNTVVKSTDYRLRDIQTGINLLQFVDFTQLTVRHSGLYKCFAAEGDQSSYTEVASDAIWISVLSSSGLYFPPPQWPECNPQDNVAVLLGTKMNISCATDPGHPQVSIALDFQGQSLTESSTISTSESQTRLMYTATILPEHHGKSFTCSITSPGEPFRGRTRECSTGTVKVELAKVKTVTVFDGAPDIVLQCRVPNGDTIRWVANTQSQVQRLTAPSNFQGLASLKNIEISDNETTISCTAIRSNITDYIQIIVIPKDQSLTLSPTDSPTLPTKQSTVSPSVFDTTEPWAKRSFTTSIATGTAGGSIFLLIILVVCLITVYRRKKGELVDQESDEAAAATSTKTTNAAGADSSGNNDAYMGLNMQDVESRVYASLQDQNRTSGTKTNQKIQTKIIQRQTHPDDIGDSYAALNLADVHRSEYASLNCNPPNHNTDENDSSHAYVNVNQKNGDTDYEVTLVPDTGTTYMNVASRR